MIAARGRGEARAAAVFAIFALLTGACGRSPAVLTEAEARRRLEARGLASTPEQLARSASEGAIDDVAALLDAGIDPDALDGRALRMAAAAGDVEMMRLLLERGAQPNPSTGAMGQSPLVTAVMRDQLEAVELLLRAGASPNARPPAAAAALHYVKGTDVARVLLEHDADPGALDHRGATPLLAAIELGDLALVELLLEHGADPGATDLQGRSALHYARAFRFSRIEQALLDAGAASTAPPQLSFEQLEAYAGRYGTLEDKPLRIVVDLGRLSLIQPSGSGMFFVHQLVPLTPTRFYRAGDPGLVIFEILMEDGRVTGLSRTAGSSCVTFPRLDAGAGDGAVAAQAVDRARDAAVDAARIEPGPG